VLLGQDCDKKLENFVDWVFDISEKAAKILVYLKIVEFI
jgi:hypothetical protein